jgi:hypothetical protein
MLKITAFKPKVNLFTAGRNTKVGGFHFGLRFCFRTEPAWVKCLSRLLLAKTQTGSR